MRREGAPSSQTLRPLGIRMIHQVCQAPMKVVPLRQPLVQTTQKRQLVRERLDLIVLGRQEVLKPPPPAFAPAQ